MSKHFTYPVAYLENNDFGNDGFLKNSEILAKNLPVVVMVQASWCGACVRAKPAFQEFANKNVGKVFACTIQADGERQSEKLLNARLQSDIDPTLYGYPHYMLFINGQLQQGKDVTGRDVASLEKYAGI